MFAKRELDIRILIKAWTTNKHLSPRQPLFEPSKQRDGGFQAGFGLTITDEFVLSYETQRCRLGRRGSIPQTLPVGPSVFLWTPSTQQQPLPNPCCHGSQQVQTSSVVVIVESHTAEGKHGSALARLVLWTPRWMTATWNPAKPAAQHATSFYDI